MPHHAQESEVPLLFEDSFDLKTSGDGSPKRVASLSSQGPELFPAETSPAMTSIYSPSPTPFLESPLTNVHDALSQDILKAKSAPSAWIPGSSSSTLETVLPTLTSFGRSESATMPSPTDFCNIALERPPAQERHRRTSSRPMPILIFKEPIGHLSFVYGTITVRDSRRIEFPPNCSQLKITPDTSSEQREMTGYRIEGSALMNVKFASRGHVTVPRTNIGIDTGQNRAAGRFRSPRLTFHRVPIKMR